MVFADRVEAGELLAKALKKYQGADAVVYGLPRGGVVVAAQVVKELKKPLDLIIIRKIGHPYNPEYALCATSANGNMVCNEENLAQVDQAWFTAELERQKIRARQQYGLYLAGRKPIPPTDKTAIIVDDGIATGLTMKAAIKEIKNQKPKQIIIAVPVISKDVADEIETEGAKLVALDTPEEFAGSVGAYYDFFPQVTDKEVITFLHFV